MVAVPSFLPFLACAAAFASGASCGLLGFCMAWSPQEMQTAMAANVAAVFRCRTPDPSPVAKQRQRRRRDTEAQRFGILRSWTGREIGAIVGQRGSSRTARGCTPSSTHIGGTPWRSRPSSPPTRRGRGTAIAGRTCRWRRWSAATGSWRCRCGSWPPSTARRCGNRPGPPRPVRARNAEEGLEGRRFQGRAHARRADAGAAAETWPEMLAMMRAATGRPTSRTCWPALDAVPALRGADDRS